MQSRHLIATALLIGVCLGALALYVGLGGQKAQPGENAQPASVETFSLIGGENKHLVIGETEILLRLETTWAGPMARVTYFINNENTTKELNVGDIVLELPGGKIVLETASDFVEYATFKVSGNFQILSSVENVVLSYLANRIAEFENKKVRVTGTVGYPYPIAIPEFPSFSLDGIMVMTSMGVTLPPENSIVTAVGTVTKVGENSYAISAESWTERGAQQPEVKYDYYGGKENLLNERATVIDYKFIENTDSLPKVIYLHDRAITIDNNQVGDPWYPEDNSFGAYFHASHDLQDHKIGFFAPYYSGFLSLQIREWYEDPTPEQQQENITGIYYAEYVCLLGIDYDMNLNAWNWVEIGYVLYEENQYPAYAF